METPADSERPEGFADEVDEALEAMWRGDAGDMDRIVDGEDTSGTGPGVGELLEGVAGEPGASDAGFGAGAKIGDFTIKSVIGRGGMGSVYLAVQDHPRRTVALKVLKRGAASRSALRRFEYEVQILARLKHPNIAQIYDAGTHQEDEGTDLPGAGHDIPGAGVPYFAMEYIPNAKPITEYARAKKLGARERLELFIKICDAVHHGHQKGIIHRDLKPGNILVDSNGEPKIIDFGVARSTDSDMAVTTLQTDIGQLIGTLQYMSPEQCDADPHDLDTRSDVYSLGVVLYELLCEKLPYDVTTVAMYEAAKLIREETPPRPSTLNRTLRGDVQTIALKALEKDRNRRYQSAADLAADISGFLSGDPIRARPPSTFYLLRKRVIKHRRRLAVVGACAAVAICAALAGIWWRGDTLQHQRELEEAQARFEARISAVGTLYHIETVANSQPIQSAGKLRHSYPDMPEAYLVMARAELRRALADKDGELTSSVIRQLQDSVVGTPENWVCAVQIAEIYRVLGDNERAASWLDRVDLEEHRDSDGWHLRSMAALDQRDAITYANRAIEVNPENILAWMRLAYLGLQTRDYDCAQRAARRVVDLGDNDAGWLLLEGRALLLLGRFEEAAERFERAVQLKPMSSSPHRALAVAYLCLRDYPASVLQHRQAIRICERESSAEWERYHCATPLWMAGDLVAATAEYRLASDLIGRPSFADIRLFLVENDRARELRDADQVEEAELCKQRARAELASVLDRPLLDQWLAQIIAGLLDQQKPAGLLDDIAADNIERFCEAHFYVAEIYLLHGQTENAEHHYRACVATRLILDPNSAAIDAMNEYFLARWRLDTLFPDPAASGAELPQTSEGDSDEEDRSEQD